MRESKWKWPFKFLLILSLYREVSASVLSAEVSPESVWKGRDTWVSSVVFCELQKVLEENRLQPLGWQMLIADMRPWESRTLHGGGWAAKAWGWGWTFQLILGKEFRTVWVTLLLKVFHIENCFVSLLPLPLTLLFFMPGPFIKIFSGKRALKELTV